MTPTDPLEAALREAFAMERATSEGNAWNANSIEFVVSRFLTNPVLATPRPAGCEACARGDRSAHGEHVTPRPAGVEHEGPTPRDCPECLRLHDGEDR